MQGQVAATPGQPGTRSADEDRAVSIRQLAPNTLSDQKNIWLYPVKAVRSREWIPAALILGTTAALVAADPHEAHYFQNTTAFHSFNNVFSGTATSVGIIAVPASMYAIGFFRKDSKMQHTALLAGEAAVDAEILTVALKAVDRRQRPLAFKPGGNYWDSWFDGKATNGSFPSGHTVAAFSVATVIAHRYRERRWVPWAAYGAASLVAFSRLPLGEHFTSDVFMGAALGYSVSRFAVLRY